MFQFHNENCSLKSIQAKISSHQPMVILRVGTVDTECRYGLSQAIIIGNNHPAVAESAQVLAREKGETTHVPYSSRLPSFIILRSNRLGGIFDHSDAFLFSNFQ